MRRSWREAVWAAVQRQCLTSATTTRQQLIDAELSKIIADVGSGGATPAQTLSRILQELRDDGVLIFDGRGRYRMSVGLAKLDVEAAVQTEAMRLQSCRIGQGRFRRKLEQRWNAACPLTRIGERALLRASHIVPWNRCQSPAERLCVDNGLLLSVLWDAAFEKGLVGFDDDGAVMMATRIEQNAERALRQAAHIRLPFLSDALRAQLARHRTIHAAMGLVRAA